MVAILCFVGFYGDSSHKSPRKDDPTGGAVKGGDGSKV
jgi:hypothetical protein